MFKIYTNGKREIRATKKAYELIYKLQGFKEKSDGMETTEDFQEVEDSSRGDTSTLKENSNNNTYDSLTIPELREKLTSRGIDFNSKARKEELIELLVEGDSND